MKIGRGFPKGCKIKAVALCCLSGNWGKKSLRQLLDKTFKQK